MDFHYDEILKMLKSQDVENRDIALMGLENLEFDNYYLRILWLKKESNIDIDIWKVIVPELAKKMRKVMNDAGESIDNPLTDIRLYNVCASFKVPMATTEDLAFCMNKLFISLTESYYLNQKYSDLNERFKIVSTND